MDSSGPRDRKSRAQAPGADGREGATKKRRRSPSPMSREQRPFRKEGARGDGAEKGDRSQRKGAKDGSSRHQGKRSQALPSEHQQQPGSRQTVSNGATKDRVKGGANDVNGGAQNMATSGESSMPFIRNDKPYRYDFLDDDDEDIILAQETGDMPDDATLRRVMGFAKFRTSHELKIPDNEHNHGVRRVKQSTYRQYMNRRDGFNRPLSPSHD